MITKFEISLCRICVGMAVVLGGSSPLQAQSMPQIPIYQGIPYMPSQFDADIQAQSDGGPQLPALSANDFVYIPSEPRRRANIARMVASIKTKDVGGAAQVEQDFAAKDVFSSLGEQLSPMGLRVDDVSHAYAAWWVQTWLLANSDFTEQSRSQFKAVVKQSAVSIGANESFLLLDNAQKQEMADWLWIQTMLMASALETVKQDPAQRSAYAKEARNIARQSGMDIDAVRLTSDGFVPARARKRSDAVDGKHGKADGFANADAQPDGKSWSNSELALVAAAGGAGLACVFLFGKAMGKKA
jgi:hypothetical protein